MDKTQEKMNFVNKKLSKLLKTNDMGTIYTILILSGMFIVLLLLVIITWNSKEPWYISEQINSLSLIVKFFDIVDYNLKF